MARYNDSVALFLLKGRMISSIPERNLAPGGGSVAYTAMRVHTMIASPPVQKQDRIASHFLLVYEHRMWYE